MIELIGPLLELVVKTGLLFAYRNEPLVAFWHGLELLCATAYFARRVIMIRRDR